MCALLKFKNLAAKVGKNPVQFLQMGSWEIFCVWTFEIDLIAKHHLKVTICQVSMYSDWCTFCFKFLSLCPFVNVNKSVTSPQVAPLVFGTIDITNLWTPFNRIRIIMGEFGCTQIRTSSSCSFDKKKDFLTCVLGSEYFAQRFNWPFDENGQTNFLAVFLPPRSLFRPNFGVINRKSLEIWA